MTVAAYRVVRVPDGAPDGWDAADALADGWTPERTREWLRANLVDVETFRAHALARARRGRGEVDEPEPPPEPPHSVTDEAQRPPVDDESDDGGIAGLVESQRHFTCLGHDHGVYFYLAHGAGQVLALTGSAHSKANLLTLAPLQFWEREFHGRQGPNWDQAANALLRWSERAGVYDPERVRGRGAWWDDGRHVLHLGDRLVVDSRETALVEHSSRYIYEAASPLRMAAASSVRPLGTREAHRLVELCELITWERPIHAKLLAGWCVVAPICGALKWRPHIWLSGPAGSGKSYVYDQILRRTCGEIAVAVASETTEAGLRQELGTDARPVVFDEFEGETAKAAARQQNVLALMRQASSDTAARIIKGTATGTSQRFEIRSCFAFSSIVVGLQQHADMTRVTVLSMALDATRTPEQRAERFSTVIQPAFEELTPAYVDGLHARTLSMIPVIRANAETFARAGAVALGTRRLGDQLGALLAGAYALHSDGQITLEAARAWLDEQDWSEETTATATRDEASLLATLLQHTVRVTSGRGTVDRSIGELAQVAHGIADPVLEIHEASSTLKRHGFKVDQDVLYVANSHAAIARILAATPWGRSWGRVLARLDGAVKLGPTRFAPGTVERCVGIPIDAVVADEPPTRQSEAPF